MLKMPSPSPASCNALVQDEQATQSARPSPPLHPLCRKGCWSNVLLPVKITYVAKRQEMSQLRRWKGTLQTALLISGFSEGSIQTMRQLSCAEWAGKEEMEEERFISSPQVTQEVSGRSMNQLFPFTPGSCCSLPSSWLCLTAKPCWG